MILEEETKEAFEYYPNILKRRSNKPIVSICTLCGRIKIVTKHDYREFCRSCCQKGKRHTDEHKAKIGAARKGHKHTDDAKALISAAHIGKHLTDEHKAKLSAVMKGKHHSDEVKTKIRDATKGKRNPMFGRKGRNNPNYGKHRTIATKAKIRAGNKGKHYSEETRAKMSAAKKGEKSYNWKGGEKLRIQRQHAKRRELGHKLLMPLAEGAEGHHVTDMHVIGIPAKVHKSIGGRRIKHRTRVLQWLKDSDKKKYKMVLCVLAKESLY